MQIIMKFGPEMKEQVKVVCRHLEVMGHPVSVKNGAGCATIHTKAGDWRTIISVRNMGGVERIVTGSKDIDDANIAEITRLDSPKAYRRDFPAGKKEQDVIRSSRSEIQAILRGRDPRFMLVVGPCSIHDETAGLEYARRLVQLSQEVRDRILVIMRVYFEKPRTTVGWEGSIQDPYLDESFDMAIGLAKARGFLLRVLGLGLPTATEFVDPITPQYISDLVSWGAIGARSAEAQAYRRMASGLSMPVAFKNGTGGSVQLAVNGVVAARAPHPFLGVDLQGRVAQIKTLGNPHCFLVLRGSSRGPNYDEQSVKDAVSLLEKAGVCPNLMVDCSHDNSQKDHKFQRVVFEDVVDQRAFGNRNIVGAMMESHLFEGRQDLRDPKQLQYGVSITDACIGWEETERLIWDAYAELANSL